MNKADLIAAIAEETKVPKATAARMLEVTIACILTTLERGGNVTLVGLGSFRVGTRAQRPGVNPRTGLPIMIPATRVPRFVSGKALKQRVALAPPRGRRSRSV